MAHGCILRHCEERSSVTIYLKKPSLSLVEYLLTS